MTTTITYAMSMALANANRDRLATAVAKDKHRILEEFIAVTGYYENLAIRLLNGQPSAKCKQTRCRPSPYDQAVRGALIVLGEAAYRI